MSWSGVLTADIQGFALLALAHRIVHFAFDNLVVEIPANVMYKLQQSDGYKVWSFSSSSTWITWWRDRVGKEQAKC